MAPTQEKETQAPEAPASEKPAWQRSFFTVVDCTREQLYASADEAAACGHLFLKRNCRTDSCLSWARHRPFSTTGLVSDRASVVPVCVV